MAKSMIAKNWKVANTKANHIPGRRGNEISIKENFCFSGQPKTPARRLAW